MSTLKYGLNIQKKTQPSRPAAPLKKKPLFGDGDSDEEDAPKEESNNAEEIGVFDEDAPPKKKTTGLPLQTKPKLKPKAPISQYGDLSARQTERKRVEEAMAIDESIYDYDAAWDALNAKSESKRAVEKEDAAQRKPKYMNNLLASADVRKRDQLRAKDKMLQREREAEGDEFADKERFVTGAYKEQQEEVRRLEEEEKQRQEEEDRKKSRLGMQGFYRKMMDEDEKRHKEAVEAADKAKEVANSVKPDDKPKEKTDLELAQELNAKGKNIIINEDGQVADKRQLLSAGLNVIPKAKPKASAAPASAARQSQQVFQGRHGNQRAVRERQSQMLEEQLEQAAKRAADDEAEERRKLEHASKSRKTEGEISSAKERYLQRKREAAAAAKEST